MTVRSRKRRTALVDSLPAAGFAEEQGVRRAVSHLGDCSSINTVASRYQNADQFPTVPALEIRSRAARLEGLIRR